MNKIQRLLNIILTLFAVLFSIYTNAQIVEDKYNGEEIDWGRY